jgi:hypothetical protein
MVRGESLNKTGEWCVVRSDFSRLKLILQYIFPFTHHSPLITLNSHHLKAVLGLFALPQNLFIIMGGLSLDLLDLLIGEVPEPSLAA